MNGIRQALARRLRGWSARRFGVDALPHAITGRRIYILPSRSGLILAALVVAMLIGGFNYGSNLGLAFGFLIASVALVGMHHCHRNLLGLIVDANSATDGFAGGYAPVEFVLRNPSNAARWDVTIRCGAGAATAVVAGAADRLEIALTVPLPLERRGVIRIRQFELSTNYPFGWFRAWTYVHAPLTIYAAPPPRGDARPPTTAAGRGTGLGADQIGDEDFAGLRDYAPGMALKHMAWKAVARGREPVVRHYLGLAAEPEWFDWRALPTLGTEARLELLCRWILDADAQGRVYGLRLPRIELGPAGDTAHRMACLRALADFDAAQRP